jgi:hypothetical protein
MSHGRSRRRKQVVKGIRGDPPTPREIKREHDGKGMNLNRPDGPAATQARFNFLKENREKYTSPVLDAEEDVREKQRAFLKANSELAEVDKVLSLAEQVEEADNALTERLGTPRFNELQRVVDRYSGHGPEWGVPSSTVNSQIPFVLDAAKKQASLPDPFLRDEEDEKEVLQVKRFSSDPALKDHPNLVTSKEQVDALMEEKVFDPEEEIPLMVALNVECPICGKLDWQKDGVAKPYFIPVDVEKMGEISVRQEDYPEIDWDKKPAVFNKLEKTPGRLVIPDGAKIMLTTDADLYLVDHMMQVHRVIRTKAKDIGLTLSSVWVVLLK